MPARIREQRAIGLAAALLFAGGSCRPAPQRSIWVSAFLRAACPAGETCHQSCANCTGTGCTCDAAFPRRRLVSHSLPHGPVGRVLRAGSCSRP
jgi:hypothetical protein